MKYYDKMPNKLPSKLPAGVKNAIGVVAVSELILENRYRREAAYWGHYEGAGCNPEADMYTEPQSIDWTTVPLTEESWLPKVGERVRVKDSCAYDEIRGKYAEVQSADPTIVLFMIGRGMWSLDPRDLEPAHAHPNAFTDDGAKERRQQSDWSGIKFGGVAVPSESIRIVKPDPYKAHEDKLKYQDAFYPAWSRNQDAKHASMLAQAKAQLERPMRTGPLKDRDRFGQKLSLRGWSTDESEP